MTSSVILSFEAARPAQIPAGPHVTLRDASSSYFKNATSDAHWAFDSFTVRLLLLDSTEQERRGLAMRKLTALIEPWATENPLFFHLTDTTAVNVKRVVDQAAEVGLEMIIQSFGTTFQMENTSAEYLARIKAEVAYAKSKGVELGG